MNNFFAINFGELFAVIFKLPLGLLLGIGSSFIFFRQALEGRLRARRAPGAVRMESWAWGLAIGGLIPCITGAYGLGIFGLFFIAALVVAVLGRSGWQTWAMLGACLVLSAGAFALGLTYTGYHAPRPARSSSSSGSAPTRTVTLPGGSQSGSTNSTDATGAGSATTSGEAPR
jgi:hypothetical protein